VAHNRTYRQFKPPAPTYAPRGLQLAYGKTKSQARAAINRRAQACRGMLAGKPVNLIFTGNRVSGRQGYYMARMGAQSWREAKRLRNDIRRQGCTCAIYTN
jgi:hypothetical protein